MADPIELPSEILLEHRAWIAALARSLVSDAQQAEDLEQETWLVALQHRPGAGRSLRRWTAKVMRNLARQRYRASVRRRDREARLERSSSEPPAADWVERLAIHRAVVDAVQELGEPYRTAILLRYFEGLPPRRIAERVGAPVKTVNTRLHRGLEQLRTRLDRRHDGDRRAWIVALLPLVTGRAARRAGAGGRGAAQLALALASAAALTVAVALLVRRGGPGGGEPVGTAPPRAGPAAAAGDELPPAPPPSAVAGAREPAAAPGTTDDDAPSAGGGAAPYRGRVVDVDARPVGGVELGFEAGTYRPLHELGGPRVTQSQFLPASSPAEPRRATSGPDGGFELPAAAGRSGRIVAAGGRWATVIPSKVSSDDGPREHVVVVAPARDLRGRVVTPDGVGLGEARVELLVPPGFETAFPELHDDWNAAGVRTRSDATGGFALADAYWIEGCSVFAELEGHAPAVVELPESPPASVELVLVPEAAPRSAVRGRVVLPDGSPARPATVTLGMRSARTDDRGEFALDLQGIERARTLRAFVPGHLPAVLEATRAGPDAPSDWPPFVALEVGDEPLAIGGRVVDAEGSPAPGVWVWAANPLSVARAQMPLLAENLVDGGERTYWIRARTRADGRFLLTGLLPRDYVLRAMDPDDKRLVMAEAGPFAAGARDAELRLPTDWLHARVAGRVVDRRGEPLAGVSVHSSMDVLVVPRPWFLGDLENSVDSRRTVTDADGRFAIDGPVGAFGTQLCLDAPEVVWRCIDLDPLLDLAELEVTLVRQVPLRIVVGPDAPALDHATLHDAGGGQVLISPYATEIRLGVRDVPLGPDELVIWVPEDARRMKLWRGGEELGEVELDLDLSAENVVAL